MSVRVLHDVRLDVDPAEFTDSDADNRDLLRQLVRSESFGEVDESDLDVALTLIANARRPTTA